MAFDYDTLIAGAGPAGCAAAYDLARAGRQVLLIDKRSFPRPKPCACGLTRKTLKALRYSVDPIIERVCNEIVLEQAASATAEADSRRPRRTPRRIRVRTRTPICAMSVRERFDDFCLHQTLAAGRNGGSATLIKIDSILALRELPTHIELDIATADGPRTLTAPILIGADGSNGQTRRLASRLHNPQAKPGEAPSPSAQDSAQDDWYAYGFALEATIPYADLPATLPTSDAPNGRAPDPKDLVFDFSPLSGGYGWLFPKGDHINIGVGAFAPSSAGHSSQKLPPSAQDLKSVTRQLLTDYAQRKLGVATLSHITGQHLAMGGHAYIPQGRVLLVGDAAGLVDPLTGEGIHSAIVSGQAAAAAILSYASADPGAPCPDSGTWDEVATVYARHLRPLQETLTFSHRAARAFYAEPERGFKAMRLPLLRSLILKTYADGLPLTKLITTLAKLTI